MDARAKCYTSSDKTYEEEEGRKNVCNWNSVSAVIDNAPHARHTLIESPQSAVFVILTSSCPARFSPFCSGRDESCSTPSESDEPSKYIYLYIFLSESYKAALTNSNSVFFFILKARLTSHFRTRNKTQKTTIRLLRAFPLRGCFHT